MWKCCRIVFALLATGEDAVSSLYTVPCYHPVIVSPRRPQGRDALVFSGMPRCLPHGTTCPALGDPNPTTSCQSRVRTSGAAAGRASSV